MARTSTIRTGDAGEYAVAAELAVRGWTVDVPRRNQQGIDLYGYHNEQRRTVGVQVKTRLASSKDFRFDESLLEPAPEVDAWVVLVALAAPGTRSNFLVVPRQHVNAILRTFDRTVQERGKTWKALYMGAHEFARYDERWDSMQSPSSGAEWLMPDWVDQELSR